MKERIFWVIALCCALSLAAASAESQEQRVRASKRLNLRSCPTCPPVRTLEAGTEMHVTVDDGGEWLQVQVIPGGETGWVSSGYVTVLPQVNVEREVERRLIHERFFTAFIWLGIAGFILSAAAWVKSRKREPRSILAALLFDPKIVVSWFVLLESGLLGLLLMTSGLSGPAGAEGMKDYLGMAAPFGYSGWALFWGFPPVRRAVRKAVPWLITWFSFGAFVILFFPLLGLAFLYSFFGGGLLHFALHCWKVVTATSPAVEAPPAAATATGGEEKKEQRRTDSVREEPVQEARPLGNTLQLEHPEW